MKQASLSSSIDQGGGGRAIWLLVFLFGEFSLELL
jgi:hypothetical protein